MCKRIPPLFFIFSIAMFCILCICSCDLLHKEPPKQKIQQLVVSYQYSSALEECKKELEKHPDDIDIELLQIYCEYQIDNMNYSLKNLKRIEKLEKTAENNETGEDYFLLGYIFYLKDLPGKSCEYFQKSEDKGFSNPLLDHYYSLSLIRCGKNSEIDAEEKLLNLIDEYPDFLKGYIDLISLYSKQSRDDEAEEIIQKAEKILKKSDEKDVCDYYVVKVKSISGTGKIEEIDDILKKKLGKPDDVIKLNAFIKIYDYLADEDKKLEAIEDFVEKYPSNPYGFYQLGLYYYINDQEKSIDYYKQSSEFADGEPFYQGIEALPYKMLGDDYYNKMMYDEAIKQYEKAEEIKKLDAYLLEQLCMCYIRKYENEGKKNTEYLLDAKEYVNNIINNYEDKCKGYNGLGNVYSAKGEPDIAIQVFNDGILNNPYEIALISNLGNTYFDVNEFDKAEKCYEDVIEMAPQYGYVHFRLADLLFQKQNYKDAITHLETATKDDSLEPTIKADAFYKLAIAFFVSELKETEQLYSNSSNPYNLYSSNPYISEFTKDKAINAISKAIEIDPNNKEYNEKYNMIKKLPTIFGEQKTENSEKTGNYLKIIASKGLNLRSGPGTNFDIVGQVAYEAKVEKLDEKNNWYKIKTAEGNTGWICAGNDKETWVIELY